MKTSKRKRSAKAEPAIEASGVDAAALAIADAPELSPAAVAAPVVEPVAESPAPEHVVVDPVVVLASNCSVKDAAALKTSLRALAHESTPVTLDASAVERVDTATMQLLCAFVRDRIGRKQSVSWRGQSQALQDAVRLLGVGALLGFEAEGVAA